jgi:hypothetical protein
MANPYIDQFSVHCAGPNCGHTKLSTNNWYTVRIFPESGELILDAWDEAIAAQDNSLPLCGEACAIRMVSRFMADVKTGLEAKAAKIEVADEAKEN